MSMAIATDNNSITIAGNFYARNDYAAMFYNTTDIWGKYNNKYTTNTDLSHIVLDYDFTSTGLPPIGDGPLAPVLTVRTTSGGEYYIRLYNYQTTTGHIHLDFSNVHSGWTVNATDTSTKIDMSDVKQLLWAFVSVNRGDASATLLDTPESFRMEITNWTVSGAADIGNMTVHEANSYYLADDYDDNYNVSPEREIEYFYNLGFRNCIDLYIGASHYYMKEKVNGTYIQTSTFKLNDAAELWINNFVYHAHKKNFIVTLAISMESLLAKDAWLQKASDGTLAASGWEPPTHFISFTNEESTNYFKNYIIKLADIQNANGQIPFIQLGEPWWWQQNGKPCFYDDATKALYKKEHNNTDMPIYTSTSDTFDSNVIQWLSDKLGLFTITLKNALKAKYPNAKYSILFFPPGMMDTSVTTMMKNVNISNTYWNYPNLDLFEIEDYDWIIDNDSQHDSVYTIAKNTFGYDESLTHYYAGYSPTECDFATSDIWNRITTSAD